MRDSSLTGGMIGAYQVFEEIGSGGMGRVYRARDSRLQRDVALKLLPPEVADDAGRLERFRQEARALAALRHPDIVTVYSIEESGGVHFLTMELVEGRTLDERIPAGGMALDDFFATALPLADALAAAHARGLVHRDVKPRNVMVDARGAVKVLDFGLAKRVSFADSVTTENPTLSGPLTTRGVLVGTLGYMSPEQIQGRAVGPPSDVFALGVVFYEMLAGGHPFRLDSDGGTLAAILQEPPAPLRRRRPDLPADVEAVVLRCLAKEPAARYPSAAAITAALQACRDRLQSHPGRIRALLGRRAVVLPLAAGVLGLAALGAWRAMESARARRERAEALAEAERLLGSGQVTAAFRLVRRTERDPASDPERQRLLLASSVAGSIHTDPSGARVWFAGYAETAPEWEELGGTPLEDVRLPAAYLRFRIEKPGYDPGERAGNPLFDTLAFVLDTTGSAPGGMVRVPGGPFQLWSRHVELDEVWIDRHEVTNHRYKEFVDAGGYSDRRFWTERFLDAGREIGFEAAMARFVDRTGRPGPATWELGSFLEGQGDHPVAGVSWYEAAAYARYAGRRLPTIYHWRKAAGLDRGDSLLQAGNLEGNGPSPVGSSLALSPFGSYDMAGNVREWVGNAVGDLRYLLGGSWAEPRHTFLDDFAADPMERLPTYGFRCALPVKEPDAKLLAPVTLARHDFSTQVPVSDPVFAAYRALFAYDPLPLEPRIERVDDGGLHWRRETASFTAAYGGERVLLQLLLPRSAASPYHAIVYAPGSSASRMPSSDELADLRFVDFLAKSGRAFAYPIYKGTYERRYSQPPRGPAERRERWVARVKDLRRTVDYLESREDIDGARLAYVGLSAGAEYGALFTSIETRFRASVLLAGGFDDTHMLDEPPEINPWNYASRVRVPTLMLNGRHDFMLPVTTGQRPFYRLLDVPEGQKRHVVLEGGHLPTDMHAVVRETLDWLDRYLGPVARPEAPSPRSP